jgi:hypothetical protein
MAKPAPKKMRGAPRRRTVEIPVLLLALAWGGLWLLWPVPQATLSQRRMSTTHIAAVPADALRIEATSAFAEPWTAAHIRLENEPVPLDAFVFRADPSATLARQFESGPRPDPNRPTLFDRRVERRRLAPPVPRAPASPPESAPAAGPGFRAAPSLRARAFSIPDTALKTLTDYPSSLCVSLQVALDRHGRPEYVFIEDGSGNAEFDRAALEAVYRGVSGATNGVGLVQIFGGKEP